MKESILRSDEGLYEERTIALVKIAIHKGFEPLQILDWLRLGMERVGTHYETGDYFIADLIFAGIIFQEVMDLDEFRLLYEVPHQHHIGRLMVASVHGDCHDIGKNIFASFAKAAGFEIVDLGTDVPKEVIVSQVAEKHPDVLGLSGMQSETLYEMRLVADALSDAGLREGLHIIIGGACIDDGVSHLSTRADYSTRDVKRAVEICKDWIQEK